MPLYMQDMCKCAQLVVDELLFISFYNYLKKNWSMILIYFIINWVNEELQRSQTIFKKHVSLFIGKTVNF